MLIIQENIFSRDMFMQPRQSLESIHFKELTEKNSLCQNSREKISYFPPQGQDF